MLTNNWKYLAKIRTKNVNILVEGASKLLLSI